MFADEILRVRVPSFKDFISDGSDLWNWVQSVVLRMCSSSGELEPVIQLNCFKYLLARQVQDCLSCQYNFGQVSSCTLHFLNLAFITVWKAGFDKNQFPFVICVTWALGMSKMSFLGWGRYFCNNRVEWRCWMQEKFW